MSDRQRALVAALEELRVADRILAGIEAGPRSGGQRTWEAFATARWRMRWPWNDWRYDDRYAYTSDDARSVNTELFEAQAAIARARERVGLPGVVPVEIPVEMAQMQALSDQGKVWSIFDDLALIRRLRTDVRDLFEHLHEEDPSVRRRVEPLADELEPGAVRSIDEGPLSPWAMTPARRFTIGAATATAVSVMIGVGVVMGLIAGDLWALAGLLALPLTLAFAVRGLEVLRGRRDLPE